MKRVISIVLSILLIISLTACGRNPGSAGGQDENGDNPGSVSNAEGKETVSESSTEHTTTETGPAAVPENFVLIKGGTFRMGSPEDEPWRSEDEIQHTVTVSDFYMSCYEVTQEEYESVSGRNPSNFSGEDLPVENVSWLDAVAYCNARSEQEGLTPVYNIDGQQVNWDRSAEGYRLPTEAEWEYACRAGTETPFYIEASPSAEEANYYGHYPYMIEDNYFSQGNLSVRHGEYRQTTVAVGSFEPNSFGLYICTEM